MQDCNDDERKIIDSFSYGEHDVYIWNLGPVKHVPIFFFPVFHHIKGVLTKLVFSVTETIIASVSEMVSRGWTQLNTTTVSNTHSYTRGASESNTFVKEMNTKGGVFLE